MESALIKIMQNTHIFASKEFSRGISKYFEMDTHGSKAFREKILNKSIHSMSREDIIPFVKQFTNKNVNKIVDELFNSYSNTAKSMKWLIYEGTIYTVKDSIRSDGWAWKHFPKFLHRQELTNNTLKSILKYSLPNGFSAMGNLLNKTHTKNVFSQETIEFINSGIDIGHIQSNIAYFSGIGSVSGILDSQSPEAISQIYNTLSNSTDKEFFRSQIYNEFLKNSSGSIKQEIVQEIFDSVYDAQLHLLREFSNKEEFKASINLNLTKKGTALAKTISDIKSIIQKSIIKVAPQNSKLNQEIGAIIESKFRESVPIVYKAILDTFKKELTVDKVLNLKGSASAKEILIASVVETLATGKSKKVKVSTSISDKLKATPLKVKYKTSGQNNRPKISTKKVLTPLRTIEGRFTSIANLQTLLSARLTNTIKKNMHKPALQNKTGRFAESVKLEAMSRDVRSGAITAFLSYMKYPYATFEPGNKQGSIERSPTRLITKSMRELAAGIIKDRMRLVVV